VDLMQDFNTASPQSIWLYWLVKETKSAMINACKDCKLVEDSLAEEIMELFEKYTKEMMTDFIYATAILNFFYFFDINEDVSRNDMLRIGFERYLER
jgi:hypothetical protein